MEDKLAQIRYEEELKQEVTKIVQDFFSSLIEEITKEKKGG